MTCFTSCSAVTASCLQYGTHPGSSGPWHPFIAIQHLIRAVVLHSNELPSVRAVQRWSWWSYHLWNSLVQELPVSHLAIWGQLLAEDLFRRVCKYLVKSPSFISPLLGSTKAERQLDASSVHLTQHKIQLKMFLCYIFHSVTMGVMK